MATTSRARQVIQLTGENVWFCSICGNDIACDKDITEWATDRNRNTLEGHPCATITQMYNVDAGIPYVHLRRDGRIITQLSCCRCSIFLGYRIDDTLPNNVRTSLLLLYMTNLCLRNPGFHVWDHTTNMLRICADGNWRTPPVRFTMPDSEVYRCRNPQCGVHHAIHNSCVEITSHCPLRAAFNWVINVHAGIITIQDGRSSMSIFCNYCYTCLGTMSAGPGDPEQVQITLDVGTLLLPDSLVADGIEALKLYNTGSL